MLPQMLQQLWILLSSQPIPTQHAAPSSQEEAEQAAGHPPLTDTMEAAAVQAAPKTTVAAVQAGGHGPPPPNVDVAVQADDLQHPRHPP